MKISFPPIQRKFLELSFPEFILMGMRSCWVGILVFILVSQVVGPPLSFIPGLLAAVIDLAMGGRYLMGRATPLDSAGDQPWPWPQASR